MQEYVRTVTVALFFSGICSFLFGDGNIGVSKYVRLVCSLCVVCAVVSPVFLTVHKISFEKPELEDSFITEYGGVTEETDAYILNMAKEKLDSEISNAVFEKFGINVSRCDIQLSVKENEGTTRVDVKSATLAVPKEHEKDIGEISAYLETILGITPEILIAGGNGD